MTERTKKWKTYRGEDEESKENPRIDLKCRREIL